MGQRAAAAVLERDQRRACRRGRDGRVAASERLQQGFLIGGDDEVTGVQQLALEPAREEVQDDAGLRGERRSRGKIQARCRQGLSAASCSQRQTVVADASQIARSSTSWCRRGVRAGSSHAIATTSAPCSGGKTARATRARPFLQPLDALLAEPPSPLAHDLRMAIDAHGDLLVLQAVGGMQDQPRPLHIPKRQRRGLRPALTLGTLVSSQRDRIRLAREARPLLRGARTGPFTYGNSSSADCSTGGRRLE